MTLEGLCRKVRQWDTRIVYHEVSFRAIDDEVNWTIEQWLMNPTSYPEHWHHPVQVASGTGVVSLARFVAATSAGDRALRLQRYETRGVTLLHRLPTR